MKKTIKVQELKAEINRLLSLETIGEKEKTTLCYLLEHILMSTKNYKGFIYPAIFTPEYDQWKKENPEKQPYEYIVNQEYRRSYL